MSDEIFELWFRAVYLPELIAQSFTAALRPGNRIKPDPKGTEEGAIVRVRILDRPGIEGFNILPEFHGFECCVKITGLLVQRLGDFQPKDLARCSGDCRTIDAAKYHLGLIYNRVFTDDDEVTLIVWEYI
ncbi:MAG TPA: hypothetical protein VD998_03275 [Verrucomicrobiae bacterium]|nr:hypothetical protein [Verrucomicrobiae bacterium]